MDEVRIVMNAGHAWRTAFRRFRPISGAAEVVRHCGSRGSVRDASHQVEKEQSRWVPAFAGM